MQDQKLELSPKQGLLWPLVAMFFFTSFLMFFVFNYIVYDNHNDAKIRLYVKEYVDNNYSDMFSNLELDSETSSRDKEDLFEIVEEYLLENPKVIVKSVETLHRSNREQQMKQSQKQVGMYKDDLENDPSSPYLGNKTAKNVLVTFFDYACSFCKQSYQNTIAKLEEQLSSLDLKIVFKERPLLGEWSVQATNVAVAIFQLSKKQYFLFHSYLMNLDAQLSQKELINYAVKELGMSKTKLVNYLENNSAKIEEALLENEKLFSALYFSGTPTSVLNGKVIRGRLDYNQVMREIKIS